MWFSSPQNSLFVKQLVQANIDEDTEAPYYWPFVREPPVTDGLSSQGASYVEKALMVLCQNDKKYTLENMEWDKSVVREFASDMRNLSQTSSSWYLVTNFTSLRDISFKIYCQHIHCTSRYSRKAWFVGFRYRTNLLTCLVLVNCQWIMPRN